MEVGVLDKYDEGFLYSSGLLQGSQNCALVQKRTIYYSLQY